MTEPWELGVTILSVGLGYWVGNAIYKALVETFRNFEKINERKWR
jgi:hypothetical protein